MAVENIFTIKECWHYSVIEIIDILKSSWGIHAGDPIEVWGVLSVEKRKDDAYICRLRNVRTIKESHLIEYPLSDNDSSKISNLGVFISYGDVYKKYKDLNNKLVKCNLYLSNEVERKKHNNPMDLCVDERSITLLTKISRLTTDDIMTDDKNLYVENSIVDYYVTKNANEINGSEKKLRDDLRGYYAGEKSRLEKEVRSLVDLEGGKKNNIAVLNDDLMNIEKDISSKNIKAENLREEINILNKEILDYVNDVNALKADIAKEEDFMSKKLEKFRSFIKDKAKILLKLEFIDEGEYNDVLMIKENMNADEDCLDFDNDLGGDYSRAISHIQAYLFHQDIMYPRYIIEDFLALVQTNDLIILAGDSGSGKTNLIKSFAKAVGGVSKIIPVKPNWTSSEDLLGYYNPLEKKYLTTPFLDALLEANRNPDVPYFICLDEMNLARVEYYFADFLSLLEERDVQPEIHLYSDDESSHILSEFKNVLTLIESSRKKFEKNNVIDFVTILQDEEINKELKRVFGFSDKDSLIKYHSDLRRMLSGVLNTPSSIVFPKNVRIIGAINIDETTHYLSPKILDRAHIMKFSSPLLFDWSVISEEVKDIKNVDKAIKFNIEDFGSRKPYPKFDIEIDFTRKVVEFTKDYFNYLGIEIGLRTIRQGLNYRDIFLQFNADEELVMNNFIVHKILPKMVFDGNKKISNELEKKEILMKFKTILENVIMEEITGNDGVYSINELDDIINKAETNDWVVNYWA